MADIAVMNKWADALESGEFRQGSNYLKGRSGAHCCLGVLCELFRREHPDDAEWQETNNYLNYSVFVVDMDYPGRSQADILLPNAVAVWAGLEMSPRNAAGVEFMILNDTQKWTFQQIAVDVRELALTNELQPV